MRRRAWCSPPPRRSARRWRNRGASGVYKGASSWTVARGTCGEGGTGLCTRAGRTQGSGVSRVLQTAHVSWSNLAKTVSPVRAVAARAAACVGCDRKIHVGWVKRTRSRSPGPAKVICPPAATVHNNASPGKRVHPAFWAPVRVAASCSGPKKCASSLSSSTQPNGCPTRRSCAACRPWPPDPAWSTAAARPATTAATPRRARPSEDPRANRRFHHFARPASLPAVIVTIACS